MSGEHARCGLDLIALGTKTTIGSMVFVYDLYNFPNWKTQILPKWYIMYQELLGQNHFWHVLQTCLDQRKMIFCPAQFFRDKFLLGTCVDVYELKVFVSMDHRVLSIRICRSYLEANLFNISSKVTKECFSVFVFQLEPHLGLHLRLRGTSIRSRQRPHWIPIVQKVTKGFLVRIGCSENQFRNHGIKNQLDIDGQTDSVWFLGNIQKQWVKRYKNQLKESIFLFLFIHFASLWFPQSSCLCNMSICRIK